MRQYLYTLEVDRGKSEPIELFLLYAMDDVDALEKARRRVDYHDVPMTLKRCQGHFMVHHTEYPPYIDGEEGQCV